MLDRRAPVMTTVSPPRARSGSSSSRRPAGATAAPSSSDGLLGVRTHSSDRRNTSTMFERAGLATASSSVGTRDAEDVAFERVQRGRIHSPGGRDSGTRQTRVATASTTRRPGDRRAPSGLPRSRRPRDGDRPRPSEVDISAARAWSSASRDRTRRGSSGASLFSYGIRPPPAGSTGRRHRRGSRW